MTDHQPTAASTYDEEASRTFVAAVRGALDPLDKFRHPTSQQMAAAVHRVSAAADTYLQAARAAHIRTLADLESARKGNADLREEAERKDDVVAELRKTIVELRRTNGRQRAELEALGEMRVERDQLRETVADLEGQLSIARDHSAGKARTAPARSGSPAQPAPAPAADTPATPGPAKGHTARRGAS